MNIPFAPNPHTLIDLSSLTPSQIDFRHIAKSLAGMRRFNGSVPFTVAQHSLAVASLVSPAARPWALLHDAHEAYTGDIPGPVKVWLKSELGDAGGKLDQIFHRLDYVIADAAGVVDDWANPEIRAEVKKADQICLQAEMEMWFDKRVLAALGPMQPVSLDLRPFIRIQDPYSEYFWELCSCINV